MAASDGTTAGEEFDHIIVGAGSAGCVIARRLVDAGRKVALVEAGGPDTNPAIHDPLRAWELWNSQEDWAYLTEPQEHSLKTSLSWPRGKVLGGSSALNGMIYIRGAKADFDNWAYNGAAGWSYDQVLPFFKKSEDFEEGASHYHGAGGPLPVTRIREPNPASLAFLEACAGYGVPLNDDPNADSILGAGLTHLTVRNGRRMSAWTSFVQPVLDSPLLTVITGAQVARLVFDGTGRAAGVRLAGTGRVLSSRTYAADSTAAPASVEWPALELRCSGDVIVCGGTIGSPQLLLLSGIGPAAQLRDCGINLVADLPGVGEQLQDHPFVMACYAAPAPLRPSAYNHGETYAALRSPLAGDWPDLHLFPILLPLATGGRQAPDGGFALVASAVGVASRGTVRLASADPEAAPLIDPRFLTEAADLNRLEAGLGIIRHAVADAAMAPLGISETWPGPGTCDSAGLRDWIRHSVGSYWHPAGTCRMGTDDGAVTDPQLRVHGIAGLRVADASVMPAIPNAPLHATVLAVAEKAAALITGAP